MPFKVSINLQVQSTKLGGWSMNFWSLLADRPTVIENTKALRDAIWGATGHQVEVPSARISQVGAGVFRRSKPIKYATNEPRVALSEANDTDYPSTAVQLICSTLTEYQTLQWLRGIPDTNISKAGQYLPKGPYLPKINAVLTLLASASNGWAVRTLDRTVEPKPMTALNVTTGLVTAPQHGIDPIGSVVSIRIKGLASPSVVNKVWRATVVSADTLQLNLWNALPANTLVAGNNPTVRRQVYIFSQINSAVTGIGTSHYTGRPTGLLGGRRKKRQTPLQLLPAAV